MKRQIVFVLVILIALVATIFWQATKNEQSALPAFEASADLTQTTVVINNQTFLSEIAKTEDQKASGLSFRDSLAKGSAMLFIFDEPSRPTFWMREMKFALDIIWINKDLKVVDITKNAQPPVEGTANEDLTIYSPNSDVVYVLEVNAGESSSINIGDTVVVHQTNEL